MDYDINKEDKVLYEGKQGIVKIYGDYKSLVEFEGGARSVPTSELIPADGLESVLNPKKLPRKKPRVLNDPKRKVLKNVLNVKHRRKRRKITEPDELTRDDIDEILEEHYSGRKRTRPKRKSYESFQHRTRPTHNEPGFLEKIAKLGESIKNHAKAAAYVIGSKTYAEHSMTAVQDSKKCYEILKKASNFEVHEIPLTWGNQYNVIVNGKKVGEIEEKVFSWGLRFNFYAGDASNGMKIGHSKSKILSIGHQATVYDEKGKQIGRIDEKVFTLNPGHLLRLYQGGQMVAISDEKMLSWTHTADIYAAKGEKKAGIIGSS
jgi:hypothetical protein